MLYHLVAHGADWTPLFRDHTEARNLWVRLVGATPGLVALCLMPDHLHVLARHDASRPVRRALGHHTQWRNQRRGETGPVFEPMGPAQEVKEGLKSWRMERWRPTDHFLDSQGTSDGRGASEPDSGQIVSLDRDPVGRMSPSTRTSCSEAITADAAVFEGSG